MAPAPGHGRLALVPLGAATLLVAAWACRGTEPAPARAWAPPIGEAAYGELLSSKAGLAIGPRELAEHAGADARWLDSALDELAGHLEPGADWQTAFERLRSDHPTDEDGVLALYRAEVERARRFVEARRLLTLPPGRLEVVRTPSGLLEARYPLVAYIGNRLAVSLGEGARLRDHCRACVPPLAVHETYPGHHAAFLLQHAGSGPEDPALRALAQEHLKNPFFHEGWGQYAEVLMLEQGYYEGRPDRELGAWRNLLFRLTRSRLDPLLHLGEVTPDQAVEELAVFVDRETAEQEVARHLAEPGGKAAYYVGLLQILELRDALHRRDPELDLRAFHDRLASTPVPVPDAARILFDVELGPGLPEGGIARFLTLPERTVAAGKMGAR